MAQQIVTLCDPCLINDGKESPAQQWGLAITVPGAKPMAFEIDVCDMHAQPYRTLLEHLAEDGRKAGKRPLPTAPATTTAAPMSTGPVPSGAGVPCPVCGRVLGAVGGLRTHVRVEHNRSLAEIEGTAGIPCTEPDCDRAFQGFQGLSSHLRAFHEYGPDRAREAVAAAKREAA